MSRKVKVVLAVALVILAVKFYGGGSAPSDVEYEDIE